MSFKDQVNSDIKNVFLNTSEFADTISYNGDEIAVVQDNDTLERKKMSNDSYSQGNLLVYAAVSDFKTKPSTKDAVKYNDRKVQIIKVDEEDGMYELTLFESGR